MRNFKELVYSDSRLAWFGPRGRSFVDSRPAPLYMSWTTMEKRETGDRRPSPDVLLQEAHHDGRGRLKIFLGAAPGVGKTYEMLTTAQVKRREGLDIIVGVVETHGRKETE